LRIAKVHHLVQQLVDDDEVISYTLLFQLFEIFCEHFDDLVEEQEDLSGIGVALREGKEVEVIMTDVEILYGLAIILNHTPRDSYIYAFVREAWWNSGTFFFGFAQEYWEFLNRGHGNVAPIVASKKSL